MLPGYQYLWELKFSLKKYSRSRLPSRLSFRFFDYEDIKENNRNKYLILDPSDENKEVLRKYKELWNGIKNKIENINDGECKYGKDFTKMKFFTNDDLPLSKQLTLQMLVIIIRSVFEDKGKFYPQVYLDECLYELRINARIRQN